MRIFAIHHRGEGGVAVDAVLAYLLAVDDNAPGSIGFTPFDELVAFLGIAARPHVRAHREREDVAVFRANHAALDGYAVAQHLARIGRLHIHDDGFIGFAEFRDQMAIGFSREPVCLSL